MNYITEVYYERFNIDPKETKGTDWGTDPDRA
jgi:hypothetical protein